MAKQHIVGETALRLKNSNPEAFADFVDAVEKTSRVVTDAVTQATSQDILVYQGRAQAYQTLLRYLKECDVVHTPRPVPPLT
jgi:uncharacterized protein YfaT (DUF1175 family)